MAHRSWTTQLDQPRAGSDWSFVPSGSDWARLLSIVGTLTVTAVDQQRLPAVTVTDDDGKTIAYDAPAYGQDNDGAYIYSWRPGNINTVIDVAGLGVCGTIPGFWLPPGSTVSAVTANLDPGNPDVQASIDSGDQSANLPVIIVTGVNDKFNFTPGGGGGTPADYTIAAGTYTTTAQVAAAVNAALDGAVAFHTQALATVADAGNGYLFTAVIDTGAAGNGDLLQSAGSDDAWATIITGGSTLTFAGGEDADGGDQWTNIVATYIAADKEHWQALEAILAQINPGG